VADLPHLDNQVIAEIVQVDDAVAQGCNVVVEEVRVTYDLEVTRLDQEEVRVRDAKRLKIKCIQICPSWIPGHYLPGARATSSQLIVGNRGGVHAENTCDPVLLHIDAARWKAGGAEKRINRTNVGKRNCAGSGSCQQGRDKHSSADQSLRADFHGELLSLKLPRALARMLPHQSAQESELFVRKVADCRD
jgi:hypothetical protein